MFTLTLSEIDFLPKWSSKQDLAVSLHRLRGYTGFLCPFITKILLLTSLILLLMDTEILQLFCRNEPSRCSANLYWKGVSQCFTLCLCIRPLPAPFIKSTRRSLISGFSRPKKLMHFTGDAQQCIHLASHPGHSSLKCLWDIVPIPWKKKNKKRVILWRTVLGKAK